MVTNPEAHLQLFAAFVNALGPEGHYSDLEPEGVAGVRDADGTLHELRRDTLRTVQAELERLRAALAEEIEYSRTGLAAAEDRATRAAW